MIKSTILTNNTNQHFFYTRIQALIWKTNGLALPEQLQKDAVTLLINTIHTIDNNKNSVLVYLTKIINFVLLNSTDKREYFISYLNYY